MDANYSVTSLALHQDLPHKNGHKIKALLKEIAL